MRAWDRKTADEIEDAFNHWDDIEVLIKGRAHAHDRSRLCRHRPQELLNILQARCEELGVELVFEREVNSDLDFPDADLIIASDGINSKIRNRYADVFQPDMVMRPNRYIWLGTNKRSTPSPSTSARPSTAGSRPTSTNSTARHRPLSSRRQKTCLRHTASTRPMKRARSPFAKNFSPKCSKARADDQRAASARLGVAEFRPPDLRQVESFQRQEPRRADG